MFIIEILFIVLLILIALFLLALSLELDSSYRVYYTTSSKDMNADLFNYILYMKRNGGVYSFKEGENHIMAWEEDGWLHYPHDPNNWEKKIYSKGQRIIRSIAGAAGGIYMVILLWVLGAEKPACLLLFLAMLPAIIYFCRRFRRDLLIQGYLDGYVYGYSDACIESIQKHNVIIDKLVSAIENRPSQ